MCRFDDTDYDIHLDNFTHASGIQRAYGRCPCTHHKACFRYAQVNMYDTIDETVAAVAAWQHHGSQQLEMLGSGFTREAHQSWQPIMPDVQAALPHVRLVSTHF